MTLTYEERTRLYCAFRACPHCDAQRGEYCLGPRGRIFKGYHWQRGPFSSIPRMGLEERKQYRERYEKLKQQILSQGAIPDHE